MAAVSIRRLGKDKPSAAHKGQNRILGDISLEIADGEFLVLIGPSGCGKTTLLRCIAGLEVPTRGEILIDGAVKNDVAPRDRDIAMVFQSYALYPHMTVRENLAFGLRMRKTPAAEIDAKVREAADMLEIGALLERYPRELSGGQRQRVAMGRAVVRRPKVFLFDEPLSNLDAALRQQMRLELLRLHRRLSATMVYVTHDQVEAMTLASRIAVLKRGELVQVGTPSQLYNQPCSTFVARFFGTPEMNLLEGKIADGRFVATDAELTVAAPGYEDGPVTLGVRAEDVSIGPPGLVPRATLDLVEHLGAEDLIHLRAGRKTLVARCEPRHTPPTGSEVSLRIAAERCHLFARPEPGSAAEAARDGVRLEPFAISGGTVLKADARPGDAGPPPGGVR